jgi:two-component system response regulator CpxR
MTDAKIRLLIVDDDIKFCSLLHDYLEPLGYEVDLVHDGRQGLQQALSENYAAVILDVMVPGMNGLDVLRELHRERPSLPVLMMTALGDETDRIAGLEVGADDYLPKTFSSRELLARLRAVLRRTATPADNSQEPREATISVGDLWLEPSSRTASVGGKPLVLTAVEYDILLLLARSPGRVRSRDQILTDVASRDFDGLDRSIDVHVSSLRKKLGDDPRSPRYIETIRSIGYRMKRPEGPSR